jgi:hypothetical protein
MREGQLFASDGSTILRRRDTKWDTILSRWDTIWPDGTQNGTLFCPDGTPFWPDGTQNGTPFCPDGTPFCHDGTPNGTQRDTNGHQNGVPCSYGQALGQQWALRLVFGG